MYKILIADPIHADGLAFLESQPDVECVVRTRMAHEELMECIDEFDGLVVRSETQVTQDLLVKGNRLQVVGRAGVGVDNIALDTATRLGVAVVNAPTGNTIAAVEHTIALLLALARHVPQADASLKRGEWRRGDFMGVEVRGKTLGIVGLGRVGSEVARRAIGLDMHVLGYDPFVSQDYCSRLGIELESLVNVLANSDFLTLHTPLTDTTRHIIGSEEIASLKKGIRLLNVARGGLIDESALQNALDSGQVAGAALDVFVQEPPQNTGLIENPQVIATPHLGGSTIEAQAQVAIEVAEQVLSVLRGQPARYTVNAPFVSPEAQALIAPFLQVAMDVGKIAIQLSEGQLSSVTLRFQGEIASSDTSGIKAAALMGLLQPITEERVNLVNANFLAEQRNLQVMESTDSNLPDQYSNLITVEILTSEGSVRVSGTYLRGTTHLVRVREEWMDAELDVPYLLFIDHFDQPGLIGLVGSITGKHDINIAFMAVGRQEVRGRATMVVGLDDPMPDSVLAEVRAVPEIEVARVVRLA